MPTYDLHLQPLAPAVQRALRRPVGFGYVPAIAVSGFQALMDQWMRVFLTAKGSDPCDLNLGTGFVDLIGSTVSPENAIEIVRGCVDDCNAQIRSMQARKRRKSADEMLEDARVTRTEVIASGPGIEVWVRITNRAGSSSVVLLPDIVGITQPG